MNYQWRIPNIHEELSQDLVEKLKLFHVELLRFNQSINLISRNTEEDADLIHFADSIAAWKIISPKINPKQPIYDIGSGSGLPGLIISILQPELTVISLDADLRKIEFQKYVASKLKLENHKTAHSRVENIKPKSIQQAVSRAFAPLGRALSIADVVIDDGGVIYFLKSNEWQSEFNEAEVSSTWNIQAVGSYESDIKKVIEARKQK